ncbi:MAG: LuxR C-terminal-related transcriptional regulator [Sulfurifustaceae bacterium]
MDLESNSQPDTGRNVDPQTNAAITLVTPSANLADALRQFLTLWGFAVHEANADAAGARLPVAATNATALLLDYRFGNKLLRQAHEGSRILVIGNRALRDVDKINLLQAGASGYIHLPRELHMLVKAIHVVSEGDWWFERSVLAGAIRKARAGANDEQKRTGPGASVTGDLTPREKAVAMYAAQGWRNREIAQHLNIAEKTVKLYMTRVYRKVGVSNRIQLAHALQSADTTPANAHENFVSADV